ncbi:hypothetical protein DERP_013835 [Dermatophagoides pteronyssinus]|uniref:Uncharacterized protein n=1 Tax=Dermatophagoides pteronyssinus TaxID=6956 RepID=A0ABQ8J2S4_DERPT|nr:hypothetical protein DERP_013835 [Dermatophagoides pteronyssinus]
MNIFKLKSTNLCPYEQKSVYEYCRPSNNSVNDKSSLSESSNIFKHMYMCSHFKQIVYIYFVGTNVDC